MKQWRFWTGMITVIFLIPLVSSARDTLPEPGGTLTGMNLEAPLDPAGRKGLGLDDAMDRFSLSDLKADLVLMEVIGVYCPQCYKQAPGFNQLHDRLNRGKNRGRVAMFALAAGGTGPEIEQLIQSGQYRFPIVGDARYEIHKLLGEPKTPFTIICRPDGSVLYTHLGVISDIDGFYIRIKEFLDTP